MKSFSSTFNLVQEAGNFLDVFTEKFGSDFDILNRHEEWFLGIEDSKSKFMLPFWKNRLQENRQELGQSIKPK